MNINKVHELLQSGDLSARELVSNCLDNIKKYDKDIHAYLEVFNDAFEQAENVDKKIKQGQSIPVLAGIPFAIKDNILIKNKKCSAGSKILEGFTAPYDSTVIEKLKKQDAIFLGRTNMDEFGMGSSTEYSAFGPTKNPHDTTRVPGGSSGGSAAAVAKEMSLTALGSDTGSSIRQPASFCGIVGLKPTYGAVSRYGLIAFASSLDQIGPLGKTVEDVEIVFNAIKGKDKLDSTSVESSKIQDSRLKIQDIKIGVPKEYFSLEDDPPSQSFGPLRRSSSEASEARNKGISKDVVASFKKSLEVFKDLGCKIKQVSIPSLKYAIETYYIIMPAEASSNLARYDGVKYGFKKEGKNLLEDYMKTRQVGFGDEVRRRILLGTYVLSAGYYEAYYGQAQKVRNLMRKDFEKIFKEVDFLLCPTSPTSAFKIGEKTKDPVEMYLSDIFTVAANLTGIPAISLPASPAKRGEPCNKEGLPIGLQIMAPWQQENRLFGIAKLFEKHAA